MTDFCFRHKSTNIFSSADKMGSRTLVVIHNISQMIPSAVMRFANAHRVVREVDIAIIAYGLRLACIHAEYRGRVGQ